MIVTFDNGDVYNIDYFNNVDLTVNSKMRIELGYSSFWMFPNNDNTWRIYDITKVPD